MRDIWDGEKIKRKIEKKMREKETGEKRVALPGIIRGDHLDFFKVRERSLAEIRRCLLDYLERKEYSTEIFDFIERDLGEAGFSKL